MLYDGNLPSVQYFSDNTSSRLATPFGDSAALDIFRNDVELFVNVGVDMAVKNVSVASRVPIEFRQPVPDVPGIRFSAQVPMFEELGCGAVYEDLIVLPPPKLTRVYPEVMCKGSTQRVVIDGADIIFVSNYVPPTQATLAGGDGSVVIGETMGAGTTAAAATPGSTAMPARKRQADNGTTAAMGTTEPATEAPVQPVVPPVVGDGTLTGVGAALLQVADATTGGAVGTQCTAATIDSLGRLETCTQMTIDMDLSGVGRLPSNGVVDALVFNGEPVGCGSNAVQVLVIEQPEIEQIAPVVVFAEREDVSVTVSGTNFLTYGVDEPTVSYYNQTSGERLDVEVKDVVIGVCERHKTIKSVQQCGKITFTVPRGTVFDEPVELVIEQPPPLDLTCAARAKVALLAMPTVDTRSAPLCAGGERVEVRGLFYEIARKFQTLEIGNVAVAGDLGTQPSGSWEVFATKTSGTILNRFGGMQLTGENLARLTAETDLAANESPEFVLGFDPELELELPGFTPLQSLTFVPKIQVFVPPSPGVCNADEALEIYGDWFIRKGGRSGEVPVATIGGATVDVAVDECTGFITDYERCKKVLLTMPDGVSGLVKITNPAPIACSYESTVTVEVGVDRPVLSGVSAPGDSICLGKEDQSITLTGEFPLVDGRVPPVLLGPLAFGSTSCVQANGAVCEEILLDVSPQRVAQGAGVVSAGEQVPIRVQASDACSSAALSSITVRTAAQITSISPSRVCLANNTPIEIEGADIESAVEFSFGRTTMHTNLVPVTNLRNCVGDERGCQRARAVIDSSMFADEVDSLDASFDIGFVTGGSCRTVRMGLRELTLVPMPVIDSLRIEPVIPDPLTAREADFDFCTDQQATISIEGSRFSVTEFSEGNGGLELIFDPTGAGEPIVYTNADSELTVRNTQLQLVLQPGELPVGEYTVSVTNGDSCTATYPDKVRVNPKITVHDILPRAIVRAELTNSVLSIDTPTVIYASGLLRGENTEVHVVGATNGVVGNGRVVVTGGVNEIELASFNARLMGAGRITIKVQSDAGCRADLENALEVIDTTQNILDSVYPNSVQSGNEIVVRARSGTTFGATTNVFLTNSDNRLFALDEVEVFDGGRAVRGIVNDQGGKTNVDVMVIDPEASAGGILRDQLTIVEREVPNADRVVPSSILDGTGEQTFVVRVLVSSYPAQSCEMHCATPGAAPQVVPCTLDGTDGSVTDITVFTVSVDKSMLQAGQSCFVRMRAAEGAGTSFADSPRIAVVPAAANAISGNQYAMALNEARYGACGVETLVPPRRGAAPARFAHVLGGRSATAALASTEFAQLDVLGAAPTMLRGTDLDTPIEGAGCAALGNFVYAFGGRSSATTQRARILNPNDVPPLSYTLKYAATGGIATAAVHTYGVSFVQAGEESLLSNTVTVPVRAGASVTLSWPQTSGTIYVYRKVNNEDMQRFATATGNSFVDDGSARSPTDEQPRLAGSLGAWSAVSGSGIAGVGGVAFATLEATNAVAGNTVVAFGGAGAGGAGVRLTADANDLPTLNRVGALLDREIVGPVVLRSFVSLNQELLTVLDGGSYEKFDFGTLSFVSSTSAIAVQTPPLGSCGAVTENQAILFGGAGSGMHKVDFVVNGAQADVTEGSVVTDNPLAAHNGAACVRTSGSLWQFGGGATLGSPSARVTVVVI